MRAGSTPTWERENGRQLRRCRECGEKCRGRRSSWCSDDCVQIYMVRAHPAAGRRLVDARDRGLCAGCHVDTEAVAGYADQATREVVGRWNHERGLRIHARRWDSAPPELVRMIQVAREEILEPYGWGHLWRRRTFWDADHLVPVADGGPSTLENLQTLCLSCHQAKTLTQRHAAMAAKGP